MTEDMLTDVAELAVSMAKNNSQPVQTTAAILLILVAALRESRAEANKLRWALGELAMSEAYYRKMHDLHGDSSLAAGRAWDSMRGAGDRARRALSTSSVIEEMRVAAESEL